MFQKNSSKKWLYMSQPSLAFIIVEYKTEQFPLWFTPPKKTTKKTRNG